MSSTDDTVELYWPKDGRFRDTYANVDVTGAGVYRVPASEEAHYRRRGWADPPEDFDGEVEDAGRARTPNLDAAPRDEVSGAPADGGTEDDGESDDETASKAEDDGGDGGETGN